MSLTSVEQGGTIDFHISTSAPKYSIAIYREGAERMVMKRVDGLKGAASDCPEPGYETGCGWPVAYRLQVPRDWPSGVYTSDFNTGAKGVAG